MDTYIHTFDESLLGEPSLEIMPMPLYHGTDARIMAMTEEERKKYQYLIERTRTELRDYFPRQGLKYYSSLFDTEDNPNRTRLLEEALLFTDSFKNGVKNFQYGDFYLTSRIDSAKRYAINSFAFGESGRFAYRILEAAIHLGIIKNMPKGLQEVYLPIKEFAEGTPQPVIYKYEGIKIKDLKNECGRPLIDHDTKFGGNYRFLGDMSDLKPEIIPLKRSNNEV